MMLPPVILPLLPFFITSWWIIALLVVLGLSIRWFCRWPGNEVTLQPVRASQYTPDMTLPDDKSLDTIVIGSGSGGCACANLLAQAGQKVLILEQHEERTGGCTHSTSVSRLDGFECISFSHVFSLSTHVFDWQHSVKRIVSGIPVCTTPVKP